MPAKPHRLSRIVGLTLILGLFIAPAPASAAPTTTTSGTTVTHTFSYTGVVETMTVPSNVTQITVTIKGGEGGWGGFDSVGRPPKGGYRGVVSGTIGVNPGDLLTVAVGEGGKDSSVAASCTRGFAQESGDTREAVGGSNPLGLYSGGNGGSTGRDGCSGFGGAGGAASVLMIGTAQARDAVATLVAGGSGGSGGSGQFVKGRISLSTHTPRADTTTANTNGERGKYTETSCRLEGLYAGRCDGGGGAGGGGGAVGGARGLLEFGQGSQTEWFGHGGNPGSNSTSGLAGLDATYEYYATNNGNGSIIISYSSGVPGQPTAVTPAAGNGSATVYWTAPVIVGESAITGYVVESATGEFTNWSTVSACTGTATSCVITGLTNGTAYKFRVSAVNGTGAGSPSAASAAVTPSGPPDAPTIDSITASDGQLQVNFTAPSSTLAITNYEYSITGGSSWISAGTTSSPLTIAGLLNGTVYAVRIRAVSAAGAGESSTATNAVPSALPGAPTITAVTAGQDGTSLVVTFVAGYAGGSTIDDFEYATSIGENTSNFETYTSAGTSSPFTINGLQTGTTYTVQLRAKNSAGYGPGSAYQTGVTLAAPSAPQITSVARGDQRLVVTYAAYDSVTSGGSPISKIEYSVDSGTVWADAGTLANPFTIAGLTNGQSYNLRLRAMNAIGVSPVSTVVQGAPAGVPSAPRQVSVTAGPASATLSWLAPVSNNGAAVESYTATAFADLSGGNVASICSTSTTSCTVSGLSNGTTYYFSVTATNAAGTSIASSPRVSAIPAALPGAPTISSVTAGNAYVSVAFSAGSVDVNAPISGYEYSVNDGGSWTATVSTTSPLLITGLTNGNAYTIRLRAKSSVGTGAQSNAVSGTPYTVPDAVDANTISYTAGGGQVTVSWSAPNSNGRDITWYEATAFNALTAGTRIQSCTTNGATSCTITGLTNGTTYYVTVQSQNAADYSPRSAPRVAVRPGTASTTSMTASLETATVGTSVTFVATVTSGASGTVNFTSGGSSITGCSAVAVVGDTATCTAGLAVGSNVVRANYSGSSTFASSTSPAITVVVSALSQTINFASLSNRVLGDGAFTVSATGGASGNPITFTSATTSVCTATGTNGVTITPRTTGTCILRANQAGNANYSAAAQVERSFEIATQYTVQFQSNGGTQQHAPITFTPGGASLTLPSDTRTSYVLAGWFDAATGGTRIGRAGDSYIPTTSITLHAQWVQASLWEMGANIKIGSMTTTAGLGTSYGASSGVNRVDIEYPADALPVGTVIDVYLLLDTSRAQRLITSTSSFATNVVVAWKATDGTVPTTAAGKPLRMTITNPNIRAGARVYSVIGESVTVVGTATQDGSVTIEITDDPEIVVTSTAPAAPTNVTGTPGSGSVTVSWTAPTSNGGASISSYLVESDGVQVCSSATTSCTVSGLTNGTSYTFTVKAVNAVGTSVASAPSAAVTLQATSTSASGGSAGSGGSSRSTVTTPTPTPEPASTPPTMPTVQDLVTDLISSGSPDPTVGATALLDGKPVTPIVTVAVDGKSMQLQIGGAQLSYQVLDSSGQPQSSQNNLLVGSRNSRIDLAFAGFQPGSTAVVVMYSTKIVLGEVAVGSDGNVRASYPVPAGIAAGLHTIQVSGVNTERKVFAAAVALRIDAVQLTSKKRLFFSPTKARVNATTAAALTVLAKKVAAGESLQVTVTPRIANGKVSKAMLKLARQRAASVIAQLRSSGLDAKFRIAVPKPIGGTRVLQSSVDVEAAWLG